MNPGIERVGQGVTTESISGWLIRDLVERFPDTMGLLTPFGIDLCCGGARMLGEALELHGAPVEATLEAVREIVERDLAATQMGASR